MRIGDFQADRIIVIDQALGDDIACVELAIDLGEENYWKFQALAVMDAHYSYGIGGSIVGLSRSPVVVFVRELFYKLDKAC